MSLNEYRDEAGRFLQAVNALDEPAQKKIDMIKKELETLKQNMQDKSVVSHQIYDLLFILFELAAQYESDLDTEWAEGRERKKKYL